MADKRREKAKVERYFPLRLPTDKHDPTEFIPPSVDETDGRTVAFIVAIKKLKACAEKEKKDVK